MVLTDAMDTRSPETPALPSWSTRSVPLDILACVAAVIVGSIFGWLIYLINNVASGGNIDMESIIFFSFIFIINVVPGLLGAGLAVACAHGVRMVSSSDKFAELEAIIGACAAGVVTLFGIFYWSGMIEVLPVVLTGVVVLIFTWIGLRWSGKLAARRFKSRAESEPHPRGT